MNLISKNKYLLSLFFVWVIVFTWALHINENNHSHKNGECQICISITSPQLNSDCGSELISRANLNFFIINLLIELTPFFNFFQYKLTRAPPESIV